MKINTNIELIFGGSFDPVHLGHVNVIKSLRKAFPDWLIRLMPCSVPALKLATSASFEQRVDMLQLAIKNISDVVIDKRENDRVGKSYTLDSLKSLSKENVNRKRVLVIGTDTLMSMNQWYQWQELKNHCHLIYVSRPNVNIEEPAKEMQRLGFNLAASAHELENSNIGYYYCLKIEEKDISSSEVRSHLLRGLSVDKLIPENVKEYIVKNQIY